MIENVIIHNLQPFHHLNHISPPFGSNSPVLIIVKMDVPGQGALIIMFITIIIIIIMNLKQIKQ